ncbi:hypothetical protein [Streptomyces erythrochromogenes]|uniref:hypothetical protein n=1 Tax=Streptomyces erythrochromogenes TaxID=285574 RepID=UPI00380CE8C4
MALHPEGVYTSGPIAHLVGLAAGGPDALEWEVLRLARITRTDHYWDVTWRDTAQTLASGWTIWPRRSARSSSRRARRRPAGHGPQPQGPGPYPSS